MPTPRHRAPTPRTTAPRRRAPPRSRCSLGARAQLPRHGTPRHLGKARPHLRPKLVVAPQDELRLRRRPGAQRAHAPAVGGAAAACGGALASCGAGRRAVARAAERVRACERKCMFIVSHSGDGELLSQSPCPDPPDSSSDLYTPRTSECSSPMWQTLCPPSPPPRALLIKVDEELPFADQSSSLSFRRAEDSSVCPTSCTVRLRSTASPLQDGTCVSTPLTSLPTRPAARPSRPATAPAEAKAQGRPGDRGRALAHPIYCLAKSSAYFETFARRDRSSEGSCPNATCVGTASAEHRASSFERRRSAPRRFCVFACCSQQSRSGNAALRTAQ